MLMDLEKFEFHGRVIPPAMHQSIREYLLNRVLDDDFLEAIVCNDLRTAVEKADDKNLWLLPVYVAYFYSEAPSEAWGSKSKVLAWLHREENAGG